MRCPVYASILHQDTGILPIKDYIRQSAGKTLHKAEIHKNPFIPRPYPMLPYKNPLEIAPKQCY